MSGFRGGARGAECLNSQAALDNEMVMEPLQAQSPPPAPRGPGELGRSEGQFHLSIRDASQGVPVRPSELGSWEQLSAPREPRALPSTGEDLRGRRRRGTGGTESSKLNGLAENKSAEDFLGSSSGYSSEDDFAGG